jgi:endonuclease III
MDDISNFHTKRDSHRLWVQQQLMTLPGVGRKVALKIL